MNEPIILTDDDTPLILTFTFKGPLDSKAQLSVDFKPMLRSVEREIREECPDYTDDQMKEWAARDGMEEELLRKKWAAYRSAFELEVQREMTSLLQDVIPGTITDVLNALLPICQFKAITETNKKEKFRSVPVVATNFRTSKIAKDVWKEVHGKINKRLEIRRGLSLDSVGFWEEMEAAWQRMKKPPAYLSHLTQEKFSEVLKISPTALRSRITRNLQTNWKGFKQALKQRLTAT